MARLNSSAMSAAAHPDPALASAGAQAVRLLAFDTATEALVLAVVDGPRTFTTTEPGGPRSSARLLPAARALLAQAGLGLRDLQAVAFGAGPGAFTGLRTSCAVAQGLAFGLGRPVLPLCSLTLVAEDARRQSGDADASLSIAVAVDARMDEAYAVRLQWRRRPDGTPDDAGDWQPLGPPSLWTVGALDRDWADHPPAAAAGSALGAFAGRLRGPLRQWPAEDNRALALAALARAAWRRGEQRDAEAALPVYLRDKVALTTAERERQRTAG